jgi:hypothetical protein
MCKVFTTDQPLWVNANGTNEAKTQAKKRNLEAITQIALLGILPPSSQESISFQTAETGG